jgi:hypothetical protein
MLVAACDRAPLGWRIDFTEHAYLDHHPREGNNPSPPEKCILSPAAAERLRRKGLPALKRAAADGTLIDHRQLPYMLFRWRDLAGKGGAAVKRWTKAQLKKDEGVVKLAKAFTSYSWSHGMGFAGLADRVSKRNTRASVDSLDQIMDRDEFRKRVEKLAGKKTRLAPAEAEVVRTFLTAWRKRDEDPRA